MNQSDLGAKYATGIKHASKSRLVLVLLLVTLKSKTKSMQTRNIFPHSIENPSNLQPCFVLYVNSFVNGTVVLL